MSSPKIKNKILFLVSGLVAGGAERVASTLANAWVSRGDQVILMPTFSGRGESFYKIFPEVKVVYLADLVSSKARTLLNKFVRLRALRQFIASERPDVIISFLPHVNVATVIASFGLGIPVVVCERNDSFVEPISYGGGLARRLTYPWADVLMVQTQVLAAKYKSSGESLRRIRVIPNPIPEQIQNIQRGFGDETKKCLISVGRLEDQKQFGLLIKVFAIIAKTHDNWFLRIIGEGPLRKVLQQQINDLGLKERIELAGRRENIGEELAKADIFVLTSKYEGFPNALLESMAVGLPCVTFDCPSGPREISMDGQVALLVPPNDEVSLRLALEQLILDKDLRGSLGKCARVSVLERFALDKVLDQWDLLFKELTKRQVVNKLSFKNRAKAFLGCMARITGVPFLIREFIFKKKAMIILYHVPTVENFKQHLEYLVKRYNIIPLEMLVNAIKDKDWSRIPSKSLVITIDDGFRENYDLLRVLKEFNIPVTLYLCSHLINTNRRFWYCAGYPDYLNLKNCSNQERLAVLKKMVGFDQEKEYDQPQALDLEQIREMSSLVDFQSHGCFHSILTKCNDQESEDEIKGSKELLERLLAKGIRHFSYPNGNYGDREIGYLLSAGYVSGATTEGGVNDLTSDCFRLKRVGVEDDASINELIGEMCGFLRFLRSLIRYSKKEVN